MTYNIDNAAKKLGLDVATLKNHIHSFYRDFCSNYEKISTTIDSGVYDKIYFEFHRLKSTYKMISAFEIESICQECCDKSREEKSFDYQQSLESIKELSDILISQITEE